MKPATTVLNLRIRRAKQKSPGPADKNARVRRRVLDVVVSDLKTDADLESFFLDKDLDMALEFALI